jgi:pimeloyl-ACP methyl ester carboxylesterase
MRRLALSLILFACVRIARAEDVVYQNAKAPGVELAATFSRPSGDAPVAAVLLLPGAGPQDRDETTAGIKPLKRLSDYLNAHQIATLRADDRGVGSSTGDFKTATLPDFASDAQAGITYLMQRRDVDPKHVGIIGHGQGAILAAIAAAQMPQQISFLVLLSGTAVTGEKVLLAQTARAEMAAGVPDEQVQADLRIGTAMYRMAMAGRSAVDMQRVLSGAPEEWAPFTDAWRKQIPRLESPWLKSFLSYDPSVALEQVKCPALALFGEKDMSIDPEQNAAAMKRAFSKGHNHEAKVKLLPGLNYLFQKAKTGMPNEYESLHESFDPSVLEEIQSWIAKNIQP